jgi:hypothetical protein
MAALLTLSRHSMLARIVARVPSLAARALPAARCSPPRHVTRCEMGQLSSLLRLLMARCKTSMSAGPESMARQEAVEKAGTAPPLPATNMSFWVESTRDDAQAMPTLQGPLADVDVLVLGGGIVGITTAYLLRKSGLKARSKHIIAARGLMTRGSPGARRWGCWSPGRCARA